MPRTLNHELIRHNFVESTLVFHWNDKYVVRCTMMEDGRPRHRATWPFVFGMNEWQSVLSAMWDVTVGDKPLLVAVWCFSPSGDETNLLHLDSYATDVFEFVELAKEQRRLPMPRCCDPDDVFSCSSGDEPVDNDDFQCPALSGFESIAALEQDSSKKAEGLAWMPVKGGGGARWEFYKEVEGTVGVLHVLPANNRRVTLALLVRVYYR